MQQLSAPLVEIQDVEQGQASKVSKTVTLREIIKSKQNESMLHIYRNEDQTTKELDLLEFIIQRFTFFLNRMHDGKHSNDGLKYISDIASLVESISDRFSEDISGAFVLEIQSVPEFGPFPSKEQVQEFMIGMRNDAWRNLAEKDVLDIKKFALDWWDVYLKNTGTAAQKSDVDGKIEAVQNLCRSYLKEFSKKWDAYPICEWFCTGYSAAVACKHFGFLRCGIMKKSERFPAVLPWTYVFSVADSFTKKGNYFEGQFDYWHTQVRSIPQHLTSVMVPQFIIDLTELKSALSVQSQQVKNIRAKLLATGVTLGLALCQFLIRIEVDNAMGKNSD